MRTHQHNAVALPHTYVAGARRCRGKVCDKMGAMERDASDSEEICMETTRPVRPRFYGIDTYQDPLGRFTFRFPIDWHKFEPTGGQEGAIYSPQANNPQTWFSVLVSRLDENVVAEDMENLSSGVDEGIQSLPESHIEKTADDVLGNLVKLERVYTFREDGAIRKRRVWVLYVDEWLMVVAYQGESPEEYQYWLPMGNFCFDNFRLPEALWFATDRELSGHMKQQAPST